MNCRHILMILSIFAACACNSGSSPQSQNPVKTQADPSQDAASFFTDSFPLRDSAMDKQPGTLDEEKQLALFRQLLKDKKPKKAFDFSLLKEEQLLGTYRNLQSAITKYEDSSDLRYGRFFSDFFERLQQQENIMADTGQVDVRTRLEIARIKSDITTGFALKKSQQKNINE
jgi:hypothetical protein